MKRIRAALKDVADKLSITNARLANARRRHRRQRKRTISAHENALRFQELADEAREQGDTASAARYDRKAIRSHGRAERRHTKAVYLVGLIKRLVQRIEELETTEGQLLAELAEWKKKHKVFISGNKASGGTRRQRLKAVALASAAACAGGRRPNFYSQPGSWDVQHCITGEHYGERSDCSSWVTSVYWSSECLDPNGNGFAGGYTGTLVAHGKQVSVSGIEPGDLVLYGSGTAHHVEMFVGPGTKTIGHGSAPVDPGVIDLFGDGQYRVFRYL